MSVEEILKLLLDTKTVLEKAIPVAHIIGKNKCCIEAEIQRIDKLYRIITSKLNQE